MPKVKTRTAIKKRFKITKTGKIIRRKSYSRHLRASKSKSRIRRMKEPVIVSPGFAKKIRKFL